MRKRTRRIRALARRYGHFGMTDVHNTTAGVRKLVGDNPMVAAMAMGGALGAISAGMSPGSAALIGAATGIAVEQALKK